MTAWLVPVGGRSALNLADVTSLSIEDARTKNGMAGRQIAAVVAGEKVAVSNVHEQGAADASRPRPGRFDGKTGRVFDLLLSALGDAAAGDRHLIKLDDLEALADDRR